MDDKEAKQDHSERTYYLSKIEYALLGLLQDLGVKALDYPGLNALKNRGYFQFDITTEGLTIKEVLEHAAIVDA